MIDVEDIKPVRAMPEPVTVELCSQCGEPWLGHLAAAGRRMFEHSSPPKGFVIKDEHVDLYDCVYMLKTKYVGPQGKQGVMGTNGPMGATGAKGDPGPPAVSVSLSTQPMALPVHHNESGGPDYVQIPPLQVRG